MLKIDGKTFMNIQEAVQWLLENNALPFQCTANYAGNTEIGMGTIVNPSPAKVRIGSLIFFADSKVSTVVGITENGFICSDQYNDLVDDVVYVSNVALNASGHLIVTLSNGENIDAGLIKQVSSFSINGSQHLIANYNDGTSTDLGEIFNGNVNISGTLNANKVTGNEIVETMTGYNFEKSSSTAGTTKEYVYAGVVKNGNKITFCVAINLTKTDSESSIGLGSFILPHDIWLKLQTTLIGGGQYLAIIQPLSVNEDYTYQDITVVVTKPSSNYVSFVLGSNTSLQLNKRTYVRIEITFLLSENLAS